MSRRCQVTGKKSVRGFQYAIRGIAKKKKGIGLKVTGRTIRRFNPNVQKRKLWNPEEGRFISMKVSASGLRNIQKRGMATVVREMRARGEKI